VAQALKLAKFGQVTVSIDGTKILANASKHAAVSYARAGDRDHSSGGFGQERSPPQRERPGSEG
jgi:hypothetical protein